MRKLSNIIAYYEIVVQQQHSSRMQFGHPLLELLFLHSSGKQLQSAHLTCMNCITQANSKNHSGCIGLINHR